MIRKLLLLLEGGVLLAAMLVVFIGWQQHSALQQPLNLDQERLLEVPAGATPGGILNRLQDEGVLHDAFWLRQYWRFNLANQPLHSGEYRLTPGLKVIDMLGLWRRGEVVQYSLTLVEGWSFHQVRAALAREPRLEQALEGLSDAEVMERLDQPGLNPEGRFFPDTYRYVGGMSDLDLLKQAYARLETVLAEEWQERAEGLPYNEPYDALIMASLIEKETGVAAERSAIAGVFVRRLKIGMRLQTDPTVIFGMGERYKGKITRADLLAPTPYAIDGMPPTPIALAGREAIHAALHPSSGSSLYFVARGDGSHVFSDSLKAHNRAVREYQLKRRADYRSSPAPALQSSE